MTAKSNATSAHVVQMQDVAVEAELTPDKARAMEDLGTQLDAPAAQAHQTEEVCFEPHPPPPKGATMNEILVDHIPPSTNDNWSNNKGLYETIFTHSCKEECCMCVQYSKSKSSVS